MKRIWLYSMRLYLRLGLFFYFKKVEVRNAENIPKNEAVMFLGNHQNALLDALLIATKNGRFSYFLTRAAVFNKPIVSKVLQSLQMLPVYRIRDGWGNLNKNNVVFSKSAELLHKNEAIVIFPEGSHNLKRTVRPLSKGFTRIIFETIENYPETTINLIPVGLNFQNATKFGDTALINFGHVIPVTKSIIEDKNKSVIQLKASVFDSLTKLTTHIDTENYDLVHEKLKDLNVDFTKPEQVNTCIENNFNNCETYKSGKNKHIKRLLKCLLIINLFVPYLIWKTIAEPKIKEIEFTSTFRFAIAITLVPFFMLIVMLFFGLVFQIKFAFIYLLNVLLLALLSIKL
ncbi:1-acyl-sn-glycerol-3-phosphate acyltransferase [Psychroserpens sp.]|uniref:1-acyl-sn-glycerol-3-phosphate acyltransferase n=1 Tax=Psychroserpens sp. TaxID=2020870 RepID=UPI002B2784E3|nr:1-acyl-sn-glycerol-3-phosphate acyltransferase [Psychroserpens sp.]